MFLSNYASNRCNVEGFQQRVPNRCKELNGTIIIVVFHGKLRETKNIIRKTDQLSVSESSTVYHDAQCILLAKSLKWKFLNLSLWVMIPPHEISYLTVLSTIIVSQKHLCWRRKRKNWVFCTLNMRHKVTTHTLVKLENPGQILQSPFQWQI